MSRLTRNRQLFLNHLRSGLLLSLLLTVAAGAAAQKRENWCLQFTGGDRFGTMTTLEGLKTLDGQTVYTFELWMRPRSQGGGERGRILEQEPGSLTWYLSDGGRIGFRADSEGGWKLSRRGAVRINEWQHVAVANDGRDIRFFVDGRLFGKAIGVPLEITDSPLLLGSGTGREGELRGFDGWIDNLRISNVCLYFEDFTPPAYREPPVWDSTTVAMFYFDEGPTHRLALDATTFNAEFQLGDSTADYKTRPLWVRDPP